MEKIINCLKGIAIFVVIAFIGIGVYDLCTASGGIFNSIASLFYSEPIIIDPHENATSNVIPFEKEEIDEQTSSPECPNLGDITEKIYIQDYNDVVVFYKETKDVFGDLFYPNLLFLKTEQGLVYNGCTNLHGFAWLWFGKETYFEFEPHFDVKPFVDKDASTCDKNYVVYSSSSADTFMAFYGYYKFPNHERYLIAARDYINEYIYPYFLSFFDTNVKIFQQLGSEGPDFNAFYDYLYRCYKTGKLFGTVDMTRYTYSLIPEGERVNYPMNDSEYFSFYKYNFFLEYNVEVINLNLLNTGWRESIDDNLEEIDTKTIEDDPIVIPTTFLKLTDGMDFFAGISYVDWVGWAQAVIKENEYLFNRAKVFEEYPVVFEVFQDGVKVNSYTFDCFEDLKYGIPLNLKPGSYEYTITSDMIIFDATFGKFDISENATFLFIYSYLENSAVVNISLKQYSSGITFDPIIVFGKPVSFVFVNKFTNESFSLVFTSSVPATLSLILPFGDYEYYISSELVHFAPNNGEVTVSATSHSFIFEYFVDAQSGFLLDAKFGNTEVLTIKIPTFEIGANVLNCSSITEIWVYHIDQNSNATIKKITNITATSDNELVVQVPYTELADNFGTVGTYQLRIFYGEKSYFTNAVQGNGQLQMLTVVYDTIMGV